MAGVPTPAVVASDALSRGESDRGQIWAASVSPGRPAPDHMEGALALERYKWLFRRVPLVVTFLVLGTAAIVLAIPSLLDANASAWWLLWQTIVVVGFLLAYLASMRQHSESSDPQVLGRGMGYLLFCAGLGFGAAGFFFFPVEFRDGQYALGLALFATAVALVPTVAVLPVPALLFLASALFPFGMQFVLHHPLDEIATLVVPAIVLTALLISFATVGRMLNRSMKLRLEHRGVLQEQQRAYRRKQQECDALRTEIEKLRVLEEELVNAKEDAERASKTKTDFLATMSHEIRTPMNGVIGTLDLLQQTSLDGEQRELVVTAFSSAETLLSIINDVLDFTRVEVGEMEVESVFFDLGKTVSEVTALMGKRATSKGVNVSWSLPERMPHVLRGDPVRFRQVLSNLIGNSVKFTEKGSIRVSAQILKETRRGVTLRFEVRDTGIGINDEVRKYLFSPFTQADGSMSRRYGGSGLGLSITKRLVELMGGEIGFDSVEGAGSTFWFNLRFGKKFGEEVTAPDLTGTRALIATSSNRNRDALVKLFEQWHVVHGTSPNAEETLKKLTQSARIGETWAYDVLIIDENLPGLTLGRFLEQVKSDPYTVETAIFVLGQASECEDLGDNPHVEGILDIPIRSSEVFDQLILQGKSKVRSDLVGSEVVRTILMSADESGGMAEGAAMRPEAMAEKLAGSVLLVEDNAVNSKVVKSLLEKLGITVKTAENGRQALERAAGERFDAILMDCQMPEMDGFEATRHIRRLNDEEAASVPIVALTANAMEGDAERCLKVGMDDYLAKPVRSGELARKLSNWLKRAPAGTEMKDEKSQLDPAPAASQSGPPPQQYNILIVDQDIISVNVLEASLARDNLCVDSVFTCADAAARLAESNWDLLFVAADGLYGAGENDFGCAALRQLLAKNTTPWVMVAADATSGAEWPDGLPNPVKVFAKPLDLLEVQGFVDGFRFESPPEESPETTSGSEAPNEGEQPPVDAKVITELREITGDAFAEVLQLYVDDGTSKLEQIGAAIQGTDAPAYTDLAHTLKSSSGNVGAMRLARLARTMEETGRRGEMADAGELHARAAAEFARVRLELEDIISGAVQ